MWNFLYVVAGVAVIALIYWAREAYYERIDPRSDEDNIKAVFEGLTGPAGPHAKVLSLERSGYFQFQNTRSTGLWRKYDVVVQRHTGEQTPFAIGVQGASVLNIKGANQATFFNADNAL
jgi:hypothetical protein